MQSAIRNTGLYRELGQVLAALRDAAVPAIVLKGAHLGEIVYDNIALRPMVDVDILVQKADLLRAGEKLLELGYTCRQAWRDVADAAHHHLPPFIKPNATPIEIHWRLMSQIGSSGRMEHPFQIDIAGLWERAQPATIAGIQTRALSPQDLLLHLCVHTSHHHKFRVGLRAFCDIAATIQHYETEIAWKQVQMRARRWGAQNCVYLTLYLAQELLEAAVPDEILDNLKADDLPPHFIAWSREQIFLNHREQQNNLPDIHILSRVQESDRLGDKILILLKTVFCSPKVIARIYPVAADSKWVYAYYPVRIKDLMFKYGRVVWRMWRGDARVAAVAERENRTNALVDWLEEG